MPRWWRRLCVHDCCHFINDVGVVDEVVVVKSSAFVNEPIVEE